MSNFNQLKENIEIFESEIKLNKEEINGIFAVANSILKKNKIPCTGCNYCITKCPKKLDIPKLISTLNEERVSGNILNTGLVVMSLKKDKRPTVCLSCKLCEKVCPQSISIHNVMKELSEWKKRK